MLSEETNSTQEKKNGQAARQSLPLPEEGREQQTPATQPPSSQNEGRSHSERIPGQEAEEANINSEQPVPEPKQPEPAQEPGEQQEPASQTPPGQNPGENSAPDSAPPIKEEINDDEEIMRFIEESKPNVYVVGTGGSGSNTLDRLFELGIQDMTLIGMNTDAHHLLKVHANKKVLLGKQLTRGRGAGSNPEIGLNAAKESKEDIKKSLGGASMVFITCGLGGGTGTGSAPLVAEIAKDMGALTVAVVTLPFSSEGRIRMENALQGLEKLRKHTDTLIVIRNDKLLSIAPDLPLNTAFKVCDEVLAGSVKGIAEMITCSGMMNVDFADLKTILSDAGYAMIGLGEASVDAKNDERSTIAIETALNSPLLDSEIQGANRALINVVGGEDMTLKEAELIVAETAKRIHPNAHIIWGARVEEEMKKSSINVLVVLGGVKFPRYGVQDKAPEGLEDIDLDIIG
ncbi:MAG: cell division protein FtsZ [Candidatus Micrarchaeia archaeon]